MEEKNLETIVENAPADKKRKKLIILLIIIVALAIAGIVGFISLRRINSNKFYYTIPYGTDFDEGIELLEKKTGGQHVLVDEDFHVLTVTKEKYLGKDNLFATMEYWFNSDGFWYVTVRVDALDGSSDYEVSQLLTEELEGAQLNDTQYEIKGSSNMYGQYLYILFKEKD